VCFEPKNEEKRTFFAHFRIFIEKIVKNPNVCYIFAIVNDIVYQIKSSVTMETLQTQIDNGAIHMLGNFFLDVDGQTEKAVKVQYLGRYHWMPKSVFKSRKLGDMTVFGIQQWMIDKVMNNF